MHWKNFLRQEYGTGIKTDFSTVVDNVIYFWTMTRIPTILAPTKIEISAKNGRGWQDTRTEKISSGDRRPQFERKLDKHWDIAADDAI